MMRVLRLIVIAGLIAYSVMLLLVEFYTSQDFVRQFFTDISGDVPFYAINTTMSVFLLWSTALLMVFSAATLKDVPEARDVRRFFISQAAVFGFMGFDDRFQFHEVVADRIGIGDHFVILVVVAIEIALLAMFGRPRHFTCRTAAMFFAGGALFAVMLAIDALAPHMMVLRLSLEDLAKTWSAALFFAFAWETCTNQYRLHALRVENDDGKEAAALRNAA